MRKTDIWKDVFEKLKFIESHYPVGMFPVKRGLSENTVEERYRDIESQCMTSVDAAITALLKGEQIVDQHPIIDHFVKRRILFALELAQIFQAIPEQSLILDRFQYQDAVGVCLRALLIDAWHRARARKLKILHHFYARRRRGYDL